MTSPQTILVTGATGFIGSQLCRALAAEGRHVRALHRFTSSLQALDGVAVDLRLGDILDPASSRRCAACRSFHAAAVGLLASTSGRFRRQSTAPATLCRRHGRRASGAWS
jgi:uncharacterized protein YbjT (DUF2867 family)